MRKCHRMDRRSFTKLLGSVAIAYNSGLKALVSGDRIVVVGAGIVGSSIAYHLTKMGAEVTVIERDRPAAHASGRSFAWINASYPKKPYSYHHLSQLVYSPITDWRLKLISMFIGAVLWSGLHRKRIKKCLYKK